jgi:hypothetical protein
MSLSWQIDYQRYPRAIRHSRCLPSAAYRLASRQLHQNIAPYLNLNDQKAFHKIVGKDKLRSNKTQVAFVFETFRAASLLN